MTSGDGSPREPILRIATSLFAALGYDNTSTSQIAEAAGLSVETLAEEFGSKRDLYLEIMERVYQAERASLEKVLEGASTATPEQTALLIHRIVDHYIDFCLAHPEFPSLWMHRWLSDASDLTELERKYIRPQFNYVYSVITPLIDAGHISPDVDLEYAFWSMIWSVHGFCEGGVLDENGDRQGPENPAVLRRFRTHLHRMIHRGTALPGPIPETP